MPCDIELANAQLKLWDYKLLESVHTPIYSPNSSDSVQAVDTFTYSYFRLAPARHKVRLVHDSFRLPNGSSVACASYNQRNKLEAVRCNE